MRSFLARHGIATSNKIKVEEYCIKPKNSLFILGTLSENPGLEVGPQPVQDNETINPLSMGALSQSLGVISFSLQAGNQTWLNGTWASTLRPTGQQFNLKFICVLSFACHRWNPYPRNLPR